MNISGKCKIYVVKTEILWYHRIEVICMVRYTDISRGSVRLNGGFWQNWRNNAREKGMMSVYERFCDTGRFGALDQGWKEGMPNKPHIFWDSDIAKWLEAAAYMLMDGRDPELEKIVDDCVDKIAAHQQEDGYFNSYFDVVEPEARFTRYTDHELYDLGHLIEAAVAYRDATGKDKFLQLMIKYADLVDRVFRVEHSAAFDTPGHEEIELALFKLYRATGDEKWHELLKYFIDKRGNSDRDKTYEVFGVDSYSQAHIPVREQTTAEGHSVRACYLYAGMADLAWLDGDEALKAACEKLFENISNKRMYITGGIGSSHVGEAFTFDHDLMNRTAYAETCASLALALFARRMSRLQPKSEYADIAEIALYNGMLAGISLDTCAFFYENPLEIHPDVIDFNKDHYRKAKDHMPIYRRKKVFECSCCPPNVLRLIGSVEEFAFTQSENALYVHHYMGAAAETAFGHVEMETGYPFDGDIIIRPAPGSYDIALRIPGWCKGWKATVNGAPVEAAAENGYIRISREWAAGDIITLSLDMPVRLMQAHPALHDDCGRVAVMRGPVVYCLEECDNGKYLKDIRICASGARNVGFNEELGVPVIGIEATRRVWPESAPLYMEFDTPARENVRATFIPFYAWANREPGEMLVWTDIDI